MFVYVRKWNVLRHTTLKRKTSKVQSHIRANNMPFGYKIQIHLIFSAKDLCIPNICCTFAAPKVKKSYYAYIIYIIAKFCVDSVQLVENNGLKTSELRLAESVIEENKEIIINRWNEYFKK